MSFQSFWSFRRQFPMRRMSPYALRMLSDVISQGNEIDSQDQLKEDFDLSEFKPKGTIENLARNMRKREGDEKAYLVYYYWLHTNFPETAILNKLDRTLNRVIIDQNKTTETHGSSEINLNPSIADFFDSRRYDNDLHYTTHVVDMLGREEEQKTLSAFLAEERLFCWLQLAGVGGQGKSRLAFELIAEARAENWDAGFLREEGLIAFEERWADWQPSRPTLLVLDYVLGRENRIGSAFRALVERRDLKTPVRLLLIERQRWDRGGLERPKMLGRQDKIPTRFQSSADGKAQWFLALFERSTAPHAELSPDNALVTEARFLSGVIELPSLSADDLIFLVRQIARLQEYDIPLADTDLEQILTRIDESGRPLFAYLLAHRLADGSFQSGWTREALLTETLQREQRTRWEATFRAEGRRCPSLDDDVLSMRLARLATIIDGYDNLDGVTILSEEGWQRPDIGALLEALVLVDGPRGSSSGFAGYVPSLQPDVLGEWFVLRALMNGTVDCGSLAQIAWRLNPQKMAAFLIRCTQDFMQRPETHMLLDVAPPTEEARRIFAASSAVLLTNLIMSVKIYPQQLLDQIEYAAMVMEIPSAMRVLGFCKLEGIAFERDLVKGFHFLRKAASYDTFAMDLLGLCYHKGFGVEANLKMALSCYRKAANAGNRVSMCALGLCYEQGIGVATDHKKAFAWYHKAAKAGSTDGMHHVGWCYTQSIGVSSDYKKAFDWFGKSADLGNVIAMTYLGICYEQGIGVQIDPKMAVVWYQRAANAGDDLAICALGLCYERGFGVEADPNEAFALYLKAANIGNSAAMRDVGLCYEHGSGVEANPAEATAWYRKAADAGNYDAMRNLGLCYEQGIGVKIDSQIATAWYRKATETKESRTEAPEG